MSRMVTSLVTQGVYIWKLGERSASLLSQDTVPSLTTPAMMAEESGLEQEAS